MNTVRGFCDAGSASGLPGAVLRLPEIFFAGGPVMALLARFAGLPFATFGFGHTDLTVGFTMGIVDGGLPEKPSETFGDNEGFGNDGSLGAPGGGTGLT